MSAMRAQVRRFSISEANLKNLLYILIKKNHMELVYIIFVGSCCLEGNQNIAICQFYVNLI